MPDTATSYLVTIGVAIISSSGGWGMLQVLLSRRQHREEAEKKKRDEERELEKEKKREQELREQLDEEKRSTLSEAQLNTQRALLTAQDERYDKLMEDYDALDRRNEQLSERMSNIHDASWLVIDALESILGRLRPFDNGEATSTTYTLTIDLDELGAARRSINDARRHLR